MSFIPSGHREYRSELVNLGTPGVLLGAPAKPFVARSITLLGISEGVVLELVRTGTDGVIIKGPINAADSQELLRRFQPQLCVPGNQLYLKFSQGQIRSAILYGEESP